jgi:uncharacterized protein
MTIRKAAWFEIYVDDMDRAKRFYEAVLDTTLEEIIDPTGQSIMMAFPSDMDTYGAGGTLVKMDGMSPGGSGTLVYFHSEDCHIEESRVVAAGGKVLNPKMEIGEFGHVCLCMDTEGNTFGFHSMA